MSNETTTPEASIAVAGQNDPLVMCEPVKFAKYSLKRNYVALAQSLP